MSDRETITLKDGTELPADDFWIYAPTWLIEKYGEPVGHTATHSAPGSPVATSDEQTKVVVPK